MAILKSYNGEFRAECLNQHWFMNRSEAKGIVEDWRLGYNHIRPHMSLDNLTPAEYALKLAGDH
jgi:putative transposase